MTAFLRFVVAVDADGRVSVTCPRSGKSAPERTLRWLADPTHGTFPLPPDNEPCQPPGLGEPVCGRLCLSATGDALARERLRVEERRVDGTSGAHRFGAYLFHALLGRALWTWIKETAEELQARCIELALSFPAQDGRDRVAGLERLSWEMMHDGTGFLAAGLPGIAVVITRLVPDTDGDAWQPRLIEAPPRVLFVVGTSLTDPSIRPAAEFVGFARELRDSGRRVLTRTVDQATTTSLRSAVREFRPDLVHFACHGDWDRDTGRGYLELTPERPGEDRRRYADQLVGALGTLDHGLPPIVVLSACRSGSTADTAGGQPAAHPLVPLAAELVARGIPMVLGMAGRVSDTACRMFTRRFNAALVNGENLLTAAAEARQAVVADGQSAVESVDWAFPALFLAGTVPSDYHPVKPSELERHPAEEWIDGYGLNVSPAFCGRSEFLEAHRDAFRPGGKRVMVVFGEPDAPSGRNPATARARGFWQVGKTRLLQELAAQAFRDGNIPVLLNFDDGDQAAPQSPRLLGIEFQKEIVQVRSILGLSHPQVDQLRLLRMADAPGAGAAFAADDPDDARLRELDPAIRFELQDYRTTTPRALLLALRHDLARLAKDARSAHESVRAGGGHVVVLLDSVDQYAPDLFNSVFSKKMLNSFGFGDADEPVPVVLTVAKNPDAKQMVHDLVEQVARWKWAHALTLRPFNVAADEDLYAYNQIVLNPHGHRQVRHILDDRVRPEQSDTNREFLAMTFGGVPGRFADAFDLESMTALLRKTGFVRALTTIEAEEQALALVRLDRVER
ncbi:CHAT domain-containing protein [Dactylosporangium sp. NPDC049525]|uniref:CHAT domain-containing protein n=1 Tax=Dactylosporangium sp. NPDC049525 TaxID=3154730 RepID=UPI00343E6C71